MSTTVRISAAAKTRLRRLQDHWQKVRGETPSDPEMLERALDFIERHQGEFVQEAAWKPLSDADIRRLRSLQGHYGAWSVADLDDIVYGEKV